MPAAPSPHIEALDEGKAEADCPLSSQAVASADTDCQAISKTNPGSATFAGKKKAKPIASDPSGETAEASEPLAPILEKLNIKWAAVETKLREMLIPTLVSISYNETPQADGSPVKEHLGLVRYRGAWRLCHAIGGLGAALEWKPLSECSVDERIDAANHIEALRLEIRKSAVAYASKIDSAVHQLSSVLSRFQ